MDWISELLGRYSLIPRLLWSMANLLNPSVCMQIACVRKKKSSYILLQLLDFQWSHLGLNQGLPDYESGALTN